MVTKVETFELLLRNAEKQFRSTFNGEPTIVTAAPGRVNLIGEHIDYNDGFVLPMALPMVTVVVGAANQTSETTVVTLTENISETELQVTFSTEAITPSEPKWANYIKGVVHHFPATVPGFNAVITTNVPIGGGLSSSASLEVAIATFLEALTDTKLSQIEKALVCQKAEHTFAMMPCGIMDQMISVLGQLQRIDCKDHTAMAAQFQSEKLVILIANSNVKHELSTSQYSVRREECEKALGDIGWKTYRNCLREGDINGDLEEILSRVKDGVQKRRARHVITEMKRTLDATIAISRSDFHRVGQLMDASHKSLDKDFEVSCPETNTLVELTRKCGGVYGSRQTGGGFGGCTVTLIEKDSVDEAIQFIAPNYLKMTGYSATFFVVAPSDGARVVKAPNMKQ